METKICTVCGEEKPIDQFGFSRPNVHRANCKECQNKYNKEYLKNNPDIAEKINKKHKIYLKKYRKVNQKKRNEYLKEWGKKNPEKKRAQKYRNRYGIDIEDYEKILKKQNGVCAICSGTDLGRKNAKYFVIDHCHETNKIRGLLCYKCNTLLGLCNDDPEILLSGALYLKN